jgi:hypothetical protein
MQLARARLGIAIILGGAAMSLATSAPASASPDMAQSLHQLSASKGSNPNSPFCKLYRKQVISQPKAEKTLSKALQSGKWPKAKKALLAEFSQEKKVEKQFLTALASAPATIRNAGAKALTVIPIEEKDVQTSKSVFSYEKAVQAAVDTTAMQEVAAVFQQYETTTCGIPTSS